MYFAQDAAARIKLVAKQRGIAIKEMLLECNLNKNTLSSMLSRGSWLQANNLAKIADYLNCSVDYLLGRTDDPTFIPQRTVLKISQKESPASDVYIAAFGGSAHVPESEITPKVAREIFEEMRNEEEE